MTTLELTRVTQGNPALIELFQRAYRQILAPAFPDTNEAETIDKFMAGLNGEIPNIDVIVNLVGKNLRSVDKAELIGISVAYYHPQHHVGNLAYNAIAPNTQQSGLGKAMVHARIDALKARAAEHGHSLKAVFLEVNNPLKSPRDLDSMDPYKRVAIFEKWGAQKINIDYVQPPVYEGGTFCDYMDLYNYPVNGRYASTADVNAFLEASYAMGYGTESAQKMQLRKMFLQLTASTTTPASDLPARQPHEMVAGFEKNALRLNLV